LRLALAEGIGCQRRGGVKVHGVVCCQRLIQEGDRCCGQQWKDPGEQVGEVVWEGLAFEN
jgi:hypothetical protein